MPAKSNRQRRYMAAELGRAEAGQKTQTGMSKRQLRDFVTKPVKPAKKQKEQH